MLDLSELRHTKKALAKAASYESRTAVDMCCNRVPCTMPLTKCTLYGPRTSVQHVMGIPPIGVCGTVIGECCIYDGALVLHESCLRSTCNTNSGFKWDTSHAISRERRASAY